MSNDKPTIGFIGLGLMGSAMVERLQSLGYPMMVVAHRARANVEAALARGAREIETARMLATETDLVMLCMDNSDAVESRMFGPEGVIAGLSPGQLVIDFGTSLPSSTLKIGAAVEAAGGAYMDAPLGRTPSHAREGKLNIMAGGPADEFESVRPILVDLGENVFHVGPLGTGHTLKLINNFYAMTSAVAMSEAFAMADRAGLPRDKLYEVMSAGPLGSGMMDFIKAEAVDGDRTKLAFSMVNGAKDVGYYRRMVADLGQTSMIAPATLAVFEEALAAGWADRWVPEMVDFLAEKKR
jgi:3-hydroxyisobutyrate dehydrogenase-like beta-hydroxyacid dehydrogenase